MTAHRVWKSAGLGIILGAGAAAAGYAGLVAWNRWRYGQADAGPGSTLLDRFIPSPEVTEHHHIHIEAPADVVLATAKAMELLDSPAIRAIIRMREIVLGGRPDERPHPKQLLDQMLSIGWVILAEKAGQEVVLGAVTQPWEAAPIFRSIPPPDFAAFAEPGYVKIAWTLRAEPLDDHSSVFHTETRVSTTDAAARARFRRYWSLVAPGVKVIRLAMLKPLKRRAEAIMKAAHRVA